MHIYNIPAGLPFLDALAHFLLHENENDLFKLTDYKILLPTRRACRNLRDSFLKIRNGQPLLLPHMSPIGDVEDEDFMIELTAHGYADKVLNIPPAISPLRRRFLLARIIMQLPDFSQNWDRSVQLANALCTLLDQIYTENLDISELPNLVKEEELAEHWQITVTFLEILSVSWPEILRDEGKIDAADRRNRMILALTDYWKNNPPQTPVIAAGSTGSIPATADLLKTVANLPKGMVLIPGLDQNIDDDSWHSLTENHPQATLRKLLNTIGVDRQSVTDWPFAQNNTDLIDSSSNPHPLKNQNRITRQWLMSETMRPSETADKWRQIDHSDDQKDRIRNALEHVELYECDTLQQEAQTASMIIRDAVEKPGHVTAFITADRDLAARVQAIVRRWGVDIDDSAGQSLGRTPIGSFIILSANVIKTQCKAAELLSFLKHKKTRIGFSHDEYFKHLNQFEHIILRGHIIARGLNGLQKKLEKQKENEFVRISENDEKRIIKMTDHISTIFADSLELSDKNAERPVSFWIKQHLMILEKSASNTIDDDVLNHETHPIWSGDDGEAAAAFFKDFNTQCDALPDMTFSDYAAILVLLMQGVTVRAKYGMHPRVHILGQLEARLINADTVILSGLNEGSWPAEPKADPWMSRPMRKDFGLPSSDHSIGLSAHDFVQGFCNQRVFLTRSDRKDGSPTTPARWIQRLKTVLSACDLDPEKILSGSFLYYAQQLDTADNKQQPVTRPAPKPPVEKRPTRLSVTAIERWMRDPYSVYAEYVLRLKKLDDIEPESDAALRGSIIHDTLDKFVKDNMSSIPQNAENMLYNIARNTLENEVEDAAQILIWWPRIQNIAQKFIQHEKSWRYNYMPFLTEGSGETTLDCHGIKFTIHAKADRLDKSKHGTLAIIDYKSGTTPNKKDIQTGYAVQLPLAAVIAKYNGFEKQQKPLETDYIAYWKYSGGKDTGQTVDIKDDHANEIITDAEHGLKNLVHVFYDENIPYYSLPKTDKAPPAQWQKYAHLARVQEWAALDEEDAA